jgi:hypothetical protein
MEGYLKYCARMPLSALALAAALCGCSSFAPQSGSARVDAVAPVATSGAGAQALPEARSTESPSSLNGLDVNLYGLSYHPRREIVHRLHLDNEVNFGLGLHYEMASDARGLTFAEAGAYHDSGRNWAKFAALGYQFKLGERWRLGGAAAIMNSRTYNDGRTFIGILPLLTYDMGRVKLNAVYLPKFFRYNEVDAFGVYLSIPLGP